MFEWMVNVKMSRLEGCKWLEGREGERKEGRKGINGGQVREGME